MVLLMSPLEALGWVLEGDRKTCLKVGRTFVDEE